MKKIILFLILAYSYSFSLTYIDTTFGQTTSSPLSVSGSCSSGSSWSYSHTDGQNNVYKQQTINYSWVDNQTCWTTTRSSIYRIDLGDNPDIPYDGFCPKTYFITDYGLTKCNHDNGGLQIVPNPDPNSNSPTCNELFEKDGILHVCDPNTNESRPEPDLQLVPNDEGQIEPSCKNGKTYVSQSIIGSNSDGSDFTNYTDRGCITPTGEDNNSNEIVPDSSTTSPTVTTNPDGSKSWNAPDGNNYHLTPNGTLTTNYPDGSSSVSQVGSNYPAGSTGGVSGSTGGGSGAGTAGTGTDGNTNNENNVSTPDTPYTPDAVATSCSDSNLTLQEKMLCELNQGMKNQNAESDPTNSLNNLLKELNKDSNTNATALNTNIKDSNALLTSSKALQENQLKELKEINTNLKNLTNSNGTTTGTTTNPVVEVDSGTADGYINGLDDYINDDTNFQEVKEATSDVTGFLGDKFSQYSDSLKTQLLGLFSSFFSINTTGLPAIGVPYNFNLFGRNFQGAFLDEEMFNRLGLDKLSIIVIFLFSMSGFLHAFRFLISSSSPVQTKDK